MALLPWLWAGYDGRDDHVAVPPRTRLGDQGSSVKAWQDHLNASGFNCGVPDGIHGGRTEAASVAYEAAQARET